MITDGVFAYLSAHATINAAVGNRVYSGKMPQDPTLPCIVFQVVSPQSFARLHGKADMDRTMFQFDLYAATYEGARDLANRLRAALEGYVGAMGSHTVRNVAVLDSGSDYFDDVPNNFRVIAEYEIWHTL